MLEETTYVIQVREVLDEKWADYFAPFSLTTGHNGTVLTGVVHDQAELFGILLKFRDLGIVLVSLTPICSKE